MHRPRRCSSAAAERAPVMSRRIAYRPAGLGHHGLPRRRQHVIEPQAGALRVRRRARNEGHARGHQRVVARSTPAPPRDGAARRPRHNCPARCTPACIAGRHLHQHAVGVGMQARLALAERAHQIPRGSRWPSHPARPTGNPARRVRCRRWPRGRASAALSRSSAASAARVRGIGCDPDGADRTPGPPARAWCRRPRASRSPTPAAWARACSRDVQRGRRWRARSADRSPNSTTRRVAAPSLPRCNARSFSSTLPSST